MKIRSTLLVAASIMVAVGGCAELDPVAEDANGVANLPPPDQVAGARDGNPSADGSAPANVATSPAPATNPDPAPAAAIPAALHGRWGLTPADCTSTKGDTKGLLVIDADRLQFYESRATPVRNVKRASETFSADFAFTGEGQSWTRFQTLALQGEKLVRTESSPMASFTYARCG